MALSSSLSLSSDSSGNFHAFHDGGGSPFADPFRVPPAFTLESSCSCAAILRHSSLVRVAAFCSWRHRGHGDDVHRALRVPMSATSVRDCASFIPFQYRRTAAALVSAAYGPNRAMPRKRRRASLRYFADVALPFPDLRRFDGPLPGMVSGPQVDPGTRDRAQHILYDFRISRRSRAVFG